MDETAPLSQEPPQTSEDTLQPEYETIHGENEDIIINNTSDLSEWGPQLADLFKTGTPPSWIDAKPGSINSVQMGEANGRWFIVKQKRYVGSKKVARIKEDKERGQLPDSRPVYAMTSVLNEIKISPVVKKALQEPAAQEIAKQAGFKSVSLVEPVIAISRHDGEKSLVYPFIESAKPLEDDLKGLSAEERRDLQHKYNQLRLALNSHLEAHGIMPSDLNARNALRDEEGNLYIADIEGYVPSV